MELITPMFGGGVVTREVDPDFPVRPTSIRGQLEFWWRATAGAKCTDKLELRNQQTFLWGGASGQQGQPSQVQIRVEVVKVGAATACVEPGKEQDTFRSMPKWNPPFAGTSLSYALFPFQGQLKAGGREIEVPPAKFVAQLKFRLHVVFPMSPSVAEPVETALWAWTNFGGLGSRTRRGCGSIKCKSFMAKNREEFIDKVKMYSSENAVRDWPTFAECVLVGKEFDKAINAWDEVIKLYRDYRQGPGLGRNPPGQAPMRPGRSRWPEPESIRRVTKKRSSQHARLNQVPDDAFPRAELGLPIVFHFKDKGDPEDTTLYPEKADRMASPLILKAVALGNGKYVPVIVGLRTKGVQKVELRDGQEVLPLPNPTFIQDPKLANYLNSPMKGRSSRGSAIEGFLNYAESQGFQRA
jgi:CRISPR-associated protein Cmr1